MPACLHVQQIYYRRRNATTTMPTLFIILMIQSTPGAGCTTYVLPLQWSWYGISIKHTVSPTTQELIMHAALKNIKTVIYLSKIIPSLIYICTYYKIDKCTVHLLPIYSYAWMWAIPINKRHTHELVYPCTKPRRAAHITNIYIYIIYIYIYIT
jgi:hypothetical protein